MQFLGYILLQMIALPLTLMPLPSFVLLGKGLGHLLLFFNFRQKIAIENIHRVFPTYSAEDRHKLLTQAYAHCGILLLEFLRSFFGFKRFLRLHCTVEGDEHIRNALTQGKGVLVLTAHLGNWELLPAYGSYILRHPITVVTKALKPKWFHKIVEKTRAKLGTHLAYEPQTLRTVLHALRKGEIVGFALDQFTGAPVGARVPFFGTPVGTHTALAVLAHRTGAPVIPGFAIRRADGSYHVIFDKAIPLTPRFMATNTSSKINETDIILDTAHFTRYLEQWIQRFPEQWLWIHRRWKGDLSPLPKDVPGEMMKPDLPASR